MKKQGENRKLEKLKVNPILMEHVKSLTSQYYPLKPHEKERNAVYCFS